MSTLKTDQRFSRPSLYVCIQILVFPQRLGDRSQRWTERKILVKQTEDDETNVEPRIVKQAADPLPWPEKDRQKSRI